MKILLATDGSPHAGMATRSLIKHVSWFANVPELHVVHIQPPMPFARAASIAGKPAVDSWQREESEAALAVAEGELDQARIPYRSAWRVGEVAAELDAYVKVNGIELVVLGSQGRSALVNLALGSVATRCIATLEVPIMIIGRETAGSGKRAAAGVADKATHY